ncbi:MAG TPA: hypothetical protein VK545_26565, partial [Streptomyces sp.]|nr:hypothetical protein [Streptomyces sp.]
TAPDGTVTQFLRHFVYAGPDGALDAVRDTALDGTTAYTLSAGGTVGQCQPVTCQFSPVCLRPSGRVEFISNPAGATSGTDADWVWGQSLTGPWYPMYQVGVFPGWTTTDPGTPEGQAHWVAPHPGAGVNNTGQPGEGPSITSAAPDWYARATFRLPDIADPATIRMAATVLNADQLAVEWRLNAGAWQPVNAAHNQPPYTLAPTAVPGAQAGVNEVFVHVRETVFPGGAAGVIMHLIATYDVAPSDYVQWTRVTCSDGTIYYLDDLGERQEALPDGWTIVPCPGGSGGTDGTDVETWPLCVLNTDGSVLQHVRAEQVYDASGAPTGPPRIVDAVTGGPVAIPGGATLGVCPDAAPSGRQIIERCGCDDADGDGVGEVRYIELWSVDPDGAEDPQLIGTYEDGDFTLPYTPVAPVDCPAGDGTTIACETVELCDSSPVPARLDAANTDPQHWAAILVPGAEANNPTGPSLQPLFDGGQVEIPPTPTQASNGSHHWSAGILSLADCACGEGTVTVTVSVDFTNDGPGDQIGGGSGLYLFLGDTQLAVDAVTAVAGASETATVTGSAPVADVLAGRLTLVVQAEGGQQGGNVKTWTLSNYQAEATTDCGRSFLRTVCRDAAGETVSTTDTLDGTTAYEPVGAVRICDKPVKTCGTGDPDGTAASGRQLIERCGCDDTNGDGVGDVRYIELWSVDPDGAGAPLLVGTYRDGDFEQPYTPVAPVDCPAGEAADGCAKQVIERCRCDDADGDGIGEVRYVELWAVDPCGGEEPVLLGTYQEDDLAAPYTPVAPVDCADEPSAPVTVLTGARSITGTTAQDLAGEFPTLQSVTLTVLAGSVLVTMSDGADVPVPAGATVTWSVVREEDGQLDTARFAGADAAASYLLVWTYRG